MPPHVAVSPALSFDLNKYLQPHKLSAELRMWMSSRYFDVRISQDLNRALCYCFTWKTYFNEAGLLWISPPSVSHVSICLCVTEFSCFYVEVSMNVQTCMLLMGTFPTFKELKLNVKRVFVQDILSLRLLAFSLRMMKPS